MLSSVASLIQENVLKRLILISDVKMVKLASTTDSYSILSILERRTITLLAFKVTTEISLNQMILLEKLKLT